MADINNVVSLGIGSPASIKFFITVGLGIGEAVVVVTQIYTVSLYCNPSPAISLAANPTPAQEVEIG